MTIKAQMAFSSSLVALAAVLTAAPIANAQTASRGESRAKTPLVKVSHLAVTGGAVQVALPATGAAQPVEFFVGLTDLPLAAVVGSKRTGLKMSADQQRAYTAQLQLKQADVMAQIETMGGQRVASMSNATNGVVVSIDAGQAPLLAQLPGVSQVLPIGQYVLDLSTTVAYIGAAAVQAGGIDGTGITVAVLDSGVDFMHYNLGGTGSTTDFNTCYAQNAVAPTGICANFYGPAAPKVIGGFDFVGEVWTGTAPNTVTTDDPNPIARAGTGGHGTSVADIILGRSADNLHKGVAPGAKLYAYKVCSAVSSSCNGTAILRGFERSLDPNGDGDLSDAVDVINLSLGASYGQRENATVLAANNASLVGSVVVVSAGNSANRPFITGSPSMAAAAISVAQTQVPNALGTPLIISAPAAVARTITNTSTVAWAPVGSGFSSTDMVPTVTLPGQTLASDMCVITTVPPGALAGKVALVRRGTCGISLKVQNAVSRGAVGFVLDNNSPGDPPSFSQGPETGPFAPTIVISLADGTLLRGAVGTLMAATGAAVPAVGSLVTTSSRGPVMQTGLIKPDIGAPGGSLAASVGTGNGQSFFGGTSGAAPMVAGSAALVLQGNPGLQPHEVKARLMNSAERQITTYAGPVSVTNPVAPVTRIGAGEVRVDRARALTTGIWDASDPAAVSLSMGVQRQAGMATYRKRVQVRNYANVARTYTIARSFRDAGDQASGAVILSAPASIQVPANGSATFMVSALVDASLLPAWQATGINGGFNGGDAALLDGPEFDGHITLTQGSETVHLPWQILPHRAHNVAAPAAVNMAGAPTAPLSLTNAAGSVTGSADVFYLTGTSPQLATNTTPREGSSAVRIDLRAVGVRPVDLGGGAMGIQFAVNTWGQQSHPNYPMGLRVFIDVDNNGTDDIEVRTQESGAFASSGQSQTLVRKVGSATGTVFFFTDSDLSTGNSILTIPMAAPALPGTGPGLALTLGSTFRFRVVAEDNYFSGAVMDSVPQMTVQLANPRFQTSSFATTVPVNGSTGLTAIRNAVGDAVSPSQLGFLMMYRDGRFNREADIVTIAP